MNDKIQSQMTDEIAYQLGEFNFPCFYSYARWKVNKEPFPLLHFFNWNLPAGTPCKNEEGYPTDWGNFSLEGKLKTELFTDISHKLNYIRGRLKSYPVNIQNDTLYIVNANSYDFRDFMAQCLQDVIYDKFVLLPPENGEVWRKFRNDIPKFYIEKGETVGTYPGTPWVKLTANKEIIDFLINENR